MINKILKILGFVLIILLIDQIGGFALRQLQKSATNRDLNYTLAVCKSDILIFGNSRAQHHYDAKLISDSLKMSCYNAGIDGGHSILLSYALIKVVTNRYIPKVIIVEIAPGSFNYDPIEYDKLAILLPYYSIYPELKPLIRLRSPYERMKLLSQIYPYNSNVFSLISSNLKKHYISEEEDNRGYVPIKNRVMNLYSEIKVEHNITSPADSNKLTALGSIINICKEKSIKLYLVSSPYFHFENEKQSNTSYSAKHALDIIHKGNVTYFDFSNDSTFIGKSRYFADINHLNDIGATLFTQSLIRKIKYLSD
jgi:hypothetical protein